MKIMEWLETKRRIILCVLGGLYLSVMVLWPLYKGGRSYTHNVWMDWQTLNAAILALVAAYITARLIQNQIKQTADLAEQRRKAKQRAAHAVLPYALQEIIDYAEKCIEVIYDLKRTSNNERPILNLDVINIIREAVEYADPKTEADFYAQVPRWARIQIVTFEHYFDHLKYKNKLKNKHGSGEYKNREPLPQESAAVIDAAILLALAGEVLDYVEKEQETLPGKLCEQRVTKVWERYKRKFLSTSESYPHIEEKIPGIVQKYNEKYFDCDADAGQDV